MIRNFQLLTPAFVHGAYQAGNANIPELRAPSVRGQLRWWWRTLGYGSGNELFGSAAGDTGSASRVQIRLESPLSQTISSNVQLLPHKNQGSKNALTARGDIFTLRLIPIRSGITPTETEQLNATLDAWLLMGAVGQRANRSAGSPWSTENVPESCERYLSQCRSLLSSSTAKIALLDYESSDIHEIRKISGTFLRHKPNDPKDPHSVPGVVFGSAGSKKPQPGGVSDPRKSSSLKLRAVHLEGRYRIAVIWSPKKTGDTPANLSAAVNQMLGSPTKAELGKLLDKVLPEFFDPVDELLSPPFVYDSIRLYKVAVIRWKEEGKSDLLERFRERTSGDDYVNLRKEPWYPVQ